MATMIPPTVHTRRYSALSPEDIFENEIVVAAGGASEVRGQLPLWATLNKTNPGRVIFLSPIDNEQISAEFADGSSQIIDLRNDGALRRLIAVERLLIDISGLPHHIWAPILKVAHDSKVHTRILYAEPESYTQHPTPASSTLFDLTVSFDGLSPLPGFARLSGPDDEGKCLIVVTLGFEGSRPVRMVLQVDPPPKVIPIVGVPGFQFEFPAFTVACNREFLYQYRAHADLQFARASCPFEVYELLKKINQDFPKHYIYLAPVGTKPHSLGTILFAIKHPQNTEILFDYPVKKPGRTKGIGIIHVYDFGTFDEL